MIQVMKTKVNSKLCFICVGQTLMYQQRWAKGPIDRSSDTDSIFRLYRSIQSVDVKVPIFVSGDYVGQFQVPILLSTDPVSWF